MISARSIVPALCLGGCFAAGLAHASAPADTSTTLKALREEAVALRALHQTPLVRDFLAATDRLPTVAPRTVAFDSARTRYWTPTELAALPEAERAALITRTLGESFYYNTRYGTPLAYARPLEILAQSELKGVAGKKLVDFGYGTIGHLRLLASLGADVTGIEVDPLLEVFYSEASDLGEIAARRGSGRLRLLTGQWPAEAAIVSAAGEGYDLFISKNTLKNGYIHPAEPVDPRRLVHLGVSDSTYVGALFELLKPGGLAMIYNLCPAPAPPGKPYIPWADGRCPFPRPMLEAAGFEVIAFDRDDSEAARKMGHALAWDSPEGGKMDLANDLFATYTLVRRPRRR
jgi:hypothetical protein